MSSSPEFVNYVLDQLRETGAVRARKMFGEYMVYVNDKPLVLVCDNTAYVKVRPETEAMLSEKGIPYEGSREHFILDVDDAALCARVIAAWEPATPVPSPRSRKKPVKGSACQKR